MKQMDRSCRLTPLPRPVYTGAYSGRGRGRQLAISSQVVDQRNSIASDVNILAPKDIHK